MSLPPATAFVADSAVIVPVYRNEADIGDLLARLADLHARVPGGIEAVLVVDGSPDACHALLAAALPRMPFASRLILLSRNFGSFAAVREGLRVAGGRFFAVMSADLQEDASVAVAFLDALRNDEADVVLGVRESRADPWTDRIASRAFWGAYRMFIQRDLPPGGVDVFGCNAAFRDHLVALTESYSSFPIAAWRGGTARAAGRCGARSLTCSTACIRSRIFRCAHSSRSVSSESFPAPSSPSSSWLRKPRGRFPCPVTRRPC
jgi:glycosyltransferase involved in cell wall biosynthesis